MNPKTLIRFETPADLATIAEVTAAAFENLEISQHTEQFIVAALRAADVLTVSLVAEAEGRVHGSRRASGGFFRAGFRRADSAGNYHFSRGVQGE